LALSKSFRVYDVGHYDLVLTNAFNFKFGSVLERYIVPHRPKYIYDAVFTRGLRRSLPGHHERTRLEFLIDFFHARRLDILTLA